ncbi:hypothetical protein B4N89_20695 [Embleya scabrispora]|uniref:Uncharacterized protein n=1 Tax=Embleya scabrispora TaxID=159449 RepID=A0A1T3P207_9ACTN|nr:hypothetical protein [Embleya scabrispora]OPC83034.1 hypothetical protein B4N89_20695 [Embleya scabrispora]
MHDAIRDLTRILNTWPLLTGEPGTRRPRPPRRELTPAEQLDRYVEWVAERREVELGIHGRGASPAPCDLDQLLAAHRLTADLCSLADRIAQAVQPAAPPSRVLRRLRHSLVRGVPARTYTELTGADPNRWDYTWRHGAPWACLWLLGAVERGLPALLEDDVTSTAASVLRGVYAAIDGQEERYAGRCPCGSTLTVAPGDDVITCGRCREARGRDDWWMLTAAAPPERVDTRPPLIDEHEQRLRAGWSAA